MNCSVTLNHQNPVICQQAKKGDVPLKTGIWLSFVLFASCSAVLAGAPNNPQELDVRMNELRQQYVPYLRSLPEKLPGRVRTALPVEWKFTYEAKETPKVEAITQAPAWHGVGFDDEKWETTTVPEWRYRTVEGDDTARDPKKLAQWSWSAFSGKAPDTICWYRTTFRAEPTAAGKRTWLCFDGVEWEAQVYLNGELLGTHTVYYEPFRFDVTGKLKEENTLAVRVISGRSYGQPMTYWGIFPDSRAGKQRYTPKRDASLKGLLPIGYHAGCGFGIFREVYLEQTGPVRVDKVFVRNDLADGIARVKTEFDGPSGEYRVEIMPENFKGRSYTAVSRTSSVEITMPDAKIWSPESPYLYRCRVTVPGSDAKDVLFGCRSFTITENAMFQLNGKPCYLRGVNIHGFNVYSYWGENDKLLNAALMLKAADFNSVRSCQHVEFPEVRELFDRLGMMSGQEQGGGYKGNLDMGIRRAPHIHTGTVLARETYNNPGVVLLTFGNEHSFDTEPIVRAVLAVDPQRIIKPISGRFFNDVPNLPTEPKELWPNLISDNHDYRGWYYGGPTVQTWSLAYVWKSDRMITVGEYGAEALDAYETMRDNYPTQFKPPAPDKDTLWASAQVRKQDVQQIVGLGRKPKNLGEYIEASQNYQEAVLADKTIGYRLSARAISGYFQFHFMDVIPAHWPKSIVSHDHRPKKGYFAMAQVNQPVVALPQLLGMKPERMKLWVTNDLPESYPRAAVRWSVSHAGKTLLSGEQKFDVPAADVVEGETIDLLPITQNVPSFDLELTLTDADGEKVSSYRRNVRVVPDGVALKSKKPSGREDPFNKPKKK